MTADSRPALPPELSRIIARCAAGVIPPNIALMHIHMRATDAEAHAALREAARLVETGCGRARLRELLRLQREHPRAREVIRATLSPLSGAPAADAIAGVARGFDLAVAESAEASVALYSLGDPQLLAAATAEIVNCLRDRGLIAPESVVLDLGCGIGRVAAALAPEVALVVGTDVSRAMLRAARERVPEENAVFVATSGRDLAAFADAAFDLVLAVDSFPYLVSAGPDVVRRHVEEAARVLRPGGALLLLNFSYRGDAAADMEEVAALAARFGLGLIRSGEAGFATWDARVFELRKPLRPAPPRSP